MKKMIRDDIPTEGIQYIGVGTAYPGQPLEVPDELVDVMKRKGFTLIKDKELKGGNKDGMG